MSFEAFVFSFEPHQTSDSCATVGIRYTDALTSTSFPVSSLNSKNYNTARHFPIPSRILSVASNPDLRIRGGAMVSFSLLKISPGRAPWTILKEVFRNEDGFSK